MSKSNPFYWLMVSVGHTEATGFQLFQLFRRSLQWNLSFLPFIDSDHNFIFQPDQLRSIDSTRQRLQGRKLSLCFSALEKPQEIQSFTAKFSSLNVNSNNMSPLWVLGVGRRCQNEEVVAGAELLTIIQADGCEWTALGTQDTAASKSYVVEGQLRYGFTCCWSSKEWYF